MDEDLISRGAVILLPERAMRFVGKQSERLQMFFKKICLNEVGFYTAEGTTAAVLQALINFTYD